MDAFYSQLLLVMSIQILCLVSPGPDFFIVVRHAMQYSRKTGLYTAAGISAGLSVHIIYSILGLGYLISSSVALFTLIRYIGAAYLIYIGIKAIRSTGMKPADAADLKPSDQVQKTPGALKAFRSPDWTGRSPCFSAPETRPAAASGTSASSWGMRSALLRIRTPTR